MRLMASALLLKQKNAPAKDRRKREIYKFYSPSTAVAIMK